jgi:hypothetical protein
MGIRRGDDKSICTPHAQNEPLRPGVVSHYFPLMHAPASRWFTFVLAALLISLNPQARAETIMHSFLATGAVTKLVGGDGKILWTEVDATGKTVWELTNADLPSPLINDATGAQRLPNGNTVICSYLIGENRTKLIEVTRDKKVVWTYTDDAKAGIHEVHILDTNGKPLSGVALR